MTTEPTTTGESLQARPLSNTASSHVFRACAATPAELLATNSSLQYTATQAQHAQAQPLQRLLSRVTAASDLTIPASTLGKAGEGILLAVRQPLPDSISHSQLDQPNGVHLADS